MPNLALDEHGQPVNPRINFQRRVDRGVHEILGLCRGVLADGIVTEAESRLLRDWLEVNPELAVAWPVDVLARRIGQIFADGVITSEEREDLTELLAELVGGTANVLVGEYAATTLPLDRPAPPIEFNGSVFVLTGKFAFAPRVVCEEATRQRGGVCANSITKRTNYLVVGTFGSSHWAHTSFGRKIMKAVDYRDSGCPLRIVSEDHWATAIDS